MGVNVHGRSSDIEHRPCKNAEVAGGIRHCARTGAPAGAKPREAIQKLSVGLYT